MERIDLVSHVTRIMSTNSGVTTTFTGASSPTQALNLQSTITPSLALGSIIEAGEVAE